MKNLFDLKGKIALVTGSSQGIGYVLAKGLAENGATIIINARTPDKAINAAQKLRDLGLDAYGYGFDVTSKKSIIESVAKITDEVGAIDILVNNAGIQRRFPILEFPESDWDDLIDVNQKAVFLMIQEVGKYMVKNKSGKIINIGSMQSELGRDTITPYAASKGAVKMITRGACVELARHNIQVNSICPGYIKTKLTEKLVKDKDFSSWLCNRTPANRWGEPEELIGAAVYLASEASNFVNGHAIFVDGGMLAAV